LDCVNSLLKQQKILIAGRSGIIGSNLFNILRDNYKIISLDNNSNILEDDFFHLDLSNRTDVKKFSESSPKCDALIFLVGLAHKKGKGKEYDEFNLINKQTLINLLSSLDEKNKLPDKIIFTSTISIYGEKISQDTYYEDSPKSPFSPYAVTKLEAEEFLLKNYETRSWVLRFSPVYAPNFQLNIKRRTRIFNRFYRVGDGENKLSLCNLKNISHVISGILEEKIPAGTYNISDKNEYSYNDLLKYMNAKWVLYIPSFFMKLLYYLGKLIDSIFLKENVTKLISNNIFPSDKIRKYIDLPSTLNDSR
tara:strand:- start:1060 stop:1980 length:921 start_codon:yes stop_codon:yes gene_type:complete